MRGLLLKAGSRNFVTPVEVDGTLEEYYKLINCDLIEYAVASVRGVSYNFIVDEEGLFKENARVVASNMSYSLGFVGNVVVLGATEDGEEKSLTDEEIANLLSGIHPCKYHDGVIAFHLSLDEIRD